MNSHRHHLIQNDRRPDTVTRKDLKQTIEDIYNGERKLLAGRHHARHISPHTPYHIITRVFQGRALLRPDEEGELNSIILGVIGAAQEQYPDVMFYAAAFLSTHALCAAAHNACYGQYPVM